MDINGYCEKKLQNIYAECLKKHLIVMNVSHLAALFKAEKCMDIF